VQPGYFVGTIRLRGEKSYTRVQATRAQGTVSEAPSAKCASQRNRRQSLLRQSPGGEEPPTLSILATAGNVGLIGAQTAGSEKSSGSLIAAFHTRHHDGMVVKNAVLEFGSAPVILPTEDVGFPESATVQPPKPFSGSANFAVQNPHAASWTGDLAVELPGIGEVRLAGPSFKSEICLAEDCRGSLAGSGLAGL
jgi:hypothetical protein